MMKSISPFPLATLLLFAGCVSTSYMAPDASPVPIENYSRVIDKPFDQTWSALIQFAGSAYFDIQHFEKQSGLLVLSYVGSSPGDFITGGQLKVKDGRQFDGDYVDYCTKYLAGYLENKVNIIVAPVDSSKTRVTVRAHYVFVCGNSEAGAETWSFESGTSDSHIVSKGAPGSGKTITLMPTYKAEKAILDAVEGTK